MSLLSFTGLAAPTSDFERLDMPRNLLLPILFFISAFFFFFGVTSTRPHLFHVYTDPGGGLI